MKIISYITQIQKHHIYAYGYKVTIGNIQSEQKSLVLLNSYIESYVTISSHHIAKYPAQALQTV